MAAQLMMYADNARQNLHGVKVRQGCALWDILVLLLLTNSSDVSTLDVAYISSIILTLSHFDYHRLSNFLLTNTTDVLFYCYYERYDRNNKCKRIDMSYRDVATSTDCMYWEMEKLYTAYMSAILLDDRTSLFRHSRYLFSYEIYFY